VASRADAIAGPDADRVPDDEATARPAGVLGSIRATLGDAYFHSWRLAAVNVSWSIWAFAISLAIALTPLAVVLLPLLAIPTAATFRITTRIARRRSVSFWDGYRGIRDELARIVGVGFAFVVAAGVLAVNIVTGLASASAVGWAMATLAAWGLVAAWVLAWTLWPIFVDPQRADRPARERLRLGATLALAHPVRLAALAAGIALLLVVSTAAVAPVLTISISLAALWSSEVVLPAADRLEARLRPEVAAGP
jgi:uncharacterized membrane protein YesL